MGRMGKSCRTSGEDIRDESHTWRVIDDFACPHPIDPAELDAVEAFLMQVVNAILSGEENIRPVEAVQKLPTATAPTHKRRKRPVLEEA
jgi:hypothetical protein